MFSFNEYIIFIISFVLGSIPFGLLIVKFHGLGNISEQGSGNIGATNVVRVAGKKLGALTFGLDFFKGFLPVVIFKYFHHESYEALAIIAISAVLGHMFTPWLKFKGGKGVASGVGVIVGLSPVVGLLCLATWGACFKATKISSAAALLAFTLMPFYFFLIEGGNKPYLIFAIVLSLLVYLKHHKNIARLLNGKEGSFKKD